MELIEKGGGEILFLALFRSDKLGQHVSGPVATDATSCGTYQLAFKVGCEIIT